jgi:hypothetical protein
MSDFMPNKDGRSACSFAGNLDHLATRISGVLRPGFALLMLILTGEQLGLTVVLYQYRKLLT